MLDDVDIFPGEVAEPEDAVFFDRARNGDGDNFDVRSDEIDANLREEGRIKIVVIWERGKFDGMQEIASAIEQCDDSFGSSNVDAEIHAFIVAWREIGVDS